MAHLTLALIACLSATSAALETAHEHSTLVAVPMRLYKRDCFKRPVLPIALTLKHSLTHSVKNPGTGMSPDDIEPFTKVLKDGYMQVDCVKDYMFEHGDKHGDKKVSYELGDVSNVSILHYHEMIAKEDRKSMTPALCFEFCRSVPGMTFFGITQGRDCYCEPYYRQMAGDSSQCDSVCEGDNSQMCGGMKKSSIYAMHSCNDLEAQAADALSNAGTAKDSLSDMVDDVKIAGENMQATADILQADFGKAGDPAASALFQKAKEFAGELTHAQEKQAKVVTAIGDAETAAQGLQKNDLTVFKEATEVEDSTAKLESLTTAAEDGAEELKKLLHLATPEFDDVTNASKTYYPIMYFVDKKHVDDPSTCGGETTRKPVIGLDIDGCAASCDADVHNCVGFSFIPDTVGKHSLCFLISKFKSVTYWTGCDAAMFLQKKKAKAMGDSVVCAGRLSSFEGTTLKPDPSGKCKACLKEATKADRCFQAAM